MADYWIYHGGNGTGGSPYWTNAYPSWSHATIVTALTVQNNRFFVAHDHVDPISGAVKAHNGPQSAASSLIVSSDRDDTSANPSFRVGVTPQFNTTDGLYNLAIDGNLLLFGVRLESGGDLSLTADADERGIFHDCYFKIGHARSFATNGYIFGGTLEFSDNVNTAITAINLGTGCSIDSLSFVNASYRTGYIFDLCAGNISNLDIRGFTNIIGFHNTSVLQNSSFMNIKTNPTIVYLPASPIQRLGEISFTNVGPSNNPSKFSQWFLNGGLDSTNAIFRNGGASISGYPTAWLFRTNTVCNEYKPYLSPWIYGSVLPGTKTFSIYITNNTNNFNDNEVWLELQCQNSIEPNGIRLTDWRNTDGLNNDGTFSITPVAQTIDSSSVWIGLNDASQGLATYRQKLSVTANIGINSLFRVRVCIGIPNIASSRYFYMDPEVEIL